MSYFSSVMVSYSTSQGATLSRTLTIPRTYLTTVTIPLFSLTAPDGFPYFTT